MKWGYFLLTPAIQHPNTAQRRVHNGRKRIPSRIPEQRPFNVRWLCLPPMQEDIPIRPDHDLGQIQAGAHALAEPKGNVDTVLRGGLADGQHLLPVRGDAVGHVFLHERDVLLVVSRPEEVWVPRDPDLAESDEGCAVLLCFGDEMQGFCDCGGFVEPAGFGLADCGFPLSDGHFE